MITVIQSVLQFISPSCDSVVHFTLEYILKEVYFTLNSVCLSVLGYRQVTAGTPGGQKRWIPWS